MPSFLHTCTVFSSYLCSAQDNIFTLLSIASSAAFFLYNLSYKLFTNILTNKRKHRLFFIERYCVKTLYRVNLNKRHQSPIGFEIHALQEANHIQTYSPETRQADSHVSDHKERATPVGICGC